MSRMYQSVFGGRALSRTRRTTYSAPPDLQASLREGQSGKEEKEKRRDGTYFNMFVCGCVCISDIEVAGLL